MPQRDFEQEEIEVSDEDEIANVLDSLIYETDIDGDKVPSFCYASALKDTFGLSDKEVIKIAKDQGYKVFKFTNEYTSELIIATNEFTKDTLTSELKPFYEDEEFKLLEIGAKKEEPEVNEDLEDSKSFTFSQIRQELKLDTNNFKIPEGTYVYGYEDEALNAVKILEKYYDDVDFYSTESRTQKNKLKYVVTFSNNKKNKIKENWVDYLDDTNEFNANDKVVIVYGTTSKDEAQTNPIKYSRAKRLLKQYQDNYNYAKIVAIESLDEAIEKHEELNPKLWDNETKELLPEVKDKLLEITDKFVEIVKNDELELEVKDRVVIGSNANFNYNENSDIDLHIVASSKPDCNKNHLDKIYNAYKSMFNNKYDITINGIPVEIYVEMDEVKARSGGIYSLETGWLKEPQQFEVPEIDQEAFESEYTKWEDDYFALLDKENLTSEDVDNYIDNIYELRKTSISNDGEFAIGNLVFKEMRNMGFLDNLKELKAQLESKEMSLGYDEQEIKLDEPEEVSIIDEIETDEQKEIVDEDLENTKEERVKVLKDFLGEGFYIIIATENPMRLNSDLNQIDKFIDKYKISNIDVKGWYEGKEEPKSYILKLSNSLPEKDLVELMEYYGQKSIVVFKLTKDSKLDAKLIYGKDSFDSSDDLYLGEDASKQKGYSKLIKTDTKEEIIISFKF